MRRSLGLTTATMLVVASMIGTGVFTTTGYLLADLGSVPAVLLAWVVGGAMAVCGALSYAELVTALPDNGGEYQLLGRIYHPAVGFVSGWISLLVAFAAPIGGAAIAFAVYFDRVVPGVPHEASALTLIAVLSALHMLRISLGGRVQNILTIGKVVLIVAFVGAGLLSSDTDHLLATPRASLGDSVMSPAFALGLILVSYAYSGWNAAAYVAGEVERPHARLPLALVGGTVIVTLLYLGLNLVFLAAAPATELSGVLEVGHVAATHLWGPGAGRLVSALIAIGLVSTIGALVMTGPRVYEAMGHHYPRLQLLASRRAEGGPTIATLLQAALAAIIALTASYDALLTYVGFTLSITAALTVAGVTVLRRREPELRRPYRTWGYPITSVAFVALMIWMVGQTIVSRPVVAVVGVATVAVGLVGYWFVREPRVRPAQTHGDAR